jgi:hypothetical protein
MTDECDDRDTCPCIQCAVYREIRTGDLSLVTAYHDALNESEAAGLDEDEGVFYQRAFERVAGNLDGHRSFERDGEDGVRIYDNHRLQETCASMWQADGYMDLERRTSAHRRLSSNA